MNWPILRFQPLAWLAMVLCIAAPLLASEPVTWSKDRNKVSADVSSTKISDVLEYIASATGWQVFLEPEAAHKTVSAKFKDLPPGDALRLLLRDLNYALVPETNSVARLFVFETSRQNATQRIRPAATGEKKSTRIANELIVKLKPGANIDEIARLLGAKVIGRIAGLNAYRLQFEDGQAADSARAQLASNSQVDSVDNNYSIDRPVTPNEVASTSVPPPSLQLKPPPESGQVIVGLVDTGVQSLGAELDKFLLKAISVAGQSQFDPNSPAHGTSMAETILRGLQAMSQGGTSVQILPVDVYGSSGTTSTFDVAAGIVQAVNGGARVINLSLGSEGDSQFLRDIIKNASASNILFIGAAGNTPVTTPFYPAAYPEVMAVTATDRGQIASYANRGDFVALGAPGGSVVYFNNQPYYVVGTSSSAALVSGIAAAYMEANKATTPKTQTFLRDNFSVPTGK